MLSRSLTLVSLIWGAEIILKKQFSTNHLIRVTSWSPKLAIHFDIMKSVRFTIPETPFLFMSVPSHWHARRVLRLGRIRAAGPAPIIAVAPDTPVSYFWTPAGWRTPSQLRVACRVAGFQTGKSSNAIEETCLDMMTVRSVPFANICSPSSSRTLRHKVSHPLKQKIVYNSYLLILGFETAKLKGKKDIGLKW